MTERPELNKTIPQPAKNLQLELENAAMQLIDVVAMDTIGVLSGADSVLDVSIHRPTTFSLPPAYRGDYGKHFARLWLMTAASVCGAIMNGGFVVATPAERMMLDVVVDLVSLAAEQHDEDYLPFWWPQAVFRVMAPLQRPDGSFSPNWYEVIHHLDPLEWFMPEQLWSQQNAA